MIHNPGDIVHPQRAERGVQVHLEPSRLSGQPRLLPKPPDEVLTAMFGGFLVGAGAAIAGGCVIGNILSGIALMGLGAMLFAVAVVLTNWATTLVYLRGLR